MFSLRRIAFAPRVGTTHSGFLKASSPATTPFQRDRRYSSSSSKPSNPSDGTPRSIAQPPAVRRTGRSTPKALKTSAVEGGKIPFVPSTDHLHPADVAISRFFAQHRPVSISLSVPMSFSETSFGSIFDSKKPSGRSLSLGSDFNELDQTAEPGNPEPSSSPHRNNNNNSNGQVQSHTTIQLPSDLLTISANYRPFHPPPAPIPQNAFTSPRNGNVRKQFIQIVQTTAPDGTTTFTARTTTATPFLGRMMIRQRKWEDRQRDMVEERGGGEDGAAGVGIMEAISVKRQRRLKMKKHKYKKLMKRTRNLRRRLEKQG